MCTFGNCRGSSVLNALLESMQLLQSKPKLVCTVHMFFVVVNCDYISNSINFVAIGNATINTSVCKNCASHLLGWRIHRTVVPWQSITSANSLFCSSASFLSELVGRKKNTVWIDFDFSEVPLFCKIMNRDSSLCFSDFYLTCYTNYYLLRIIITLQCSKHIYYYLHLFAGTSKLLRIPHSREWQLWLLRW